ncbi:MAG: helix-turn-helix domain-containing protein [Tannerellaceae bacterium]|jgi:AraC-like DNA-binding protein|nr:helix-turn-helix domain-containing protein [Tannerellaceae bacterium]
MKPIYTLFIICTGLLSPHFAPAQDNDIQQQKDSLLKVINNSEGKAKIEAYGALHMLMFYRVTDRKSYDEYSALSREYQKEAEKQNNPKLQGQMMASDIIVAVRCGEYDEARKRAPETLNFLKSIGNTESVYVVHKQLILSRCRAGEYDQALSELKQMYELSMTGDDAEGQFYFNYYSGIVYMYQDRLKEAEEHYRKSIEISKALKKKPFHLVQVYSELCNMLQTTKRFSDFFSMMKACENVLKEIEKEDRQNRNFKPDWENLWTLYAYAYSAQRDFDKAGYYCDLLEKSDQTPTTLFNITNIRASIFDARGEYEKALEQIDKSIELDSFYLYTRHRKIEILSHLENAPRTWEETEKTILITDSIRNANFNAQLDELRTQYEVDRHIAEKQRTRNYLFFALAGCFILALALGIWIYYTRLVRQKNRSLFHRIQELTHIKKEAEERQLNAPEEKLSREMQFFRRLSQYMQDKKPFTDSALNRKTLAAHMNTNEMYLADAIREATGETFSSYISGLRLQYALMLLNEQPGLTLDTVAAYSGYGSYSPFFHSFAKKFGITPSEYRKMSAAKNGK